MKTTLGALGLTAIVVLLGTACGDVYADPGGEDIPIPRSDAMAVLPKDVPVQCPSQRPNENGPCQFEGSTCEYGTSPDMQCNKTYACTPDSAGSFWLERSVDRCVKSLCPAEPQAIETLDGQPCEIPPPTIVTRLRMPPGPATQAAPRVRSESRDRCRALG